MSKPFVFVLMPFDPAFDDVYKLGIKAAAEEAGAYCERVDEQYYDERVLDRIYNQITKADYIVADMSGRNPNVFYETGYAHAFNKKAILVVDNVDDIPFDLKHHHHIVYNGSISTLKSELVKRLTFFMSNPSLPDTQGFTNLEFSLNGIRIVDGIEIEIDPPAKYSSELAIQIDIHNTSDRIFRSGFEISLECGIYLFHNRHPANEFAPIVVNEKRVLHRAGRVEKLLANSYTSKAFILTPKTSNFLGGLSYSKFPMILRIVNEIHSYNLIFKVLTPRGNTQPSVVSQPVELDDVPF